MSSPYAQWQIDLTTPLYIVLSFINLYYIVTTYIFWRLRNVDIIARRLPVVLLLASVIHLLLTNIFLLDGNIPTFLSRRGCHFQIWLYHLTAPMWLFIYLIRSCHLVYIFAMSQARMAVQQRQQRDSEPQAAVQTVRPKFLVKMVVALFNFLSWEPKKADSDKTKKSLPQDQFRNLTAAVVLRGMAIFMFFVIILTLIFVEAQPKESLAEDTCGQSTFFAIYAFIGIFFILMPIVLIALWRINDPLGMRLELAVSMAMFYPLFALYLAQAVGGVPLITGAMNSSLLLAILQFVNHSIHINWPIYLTIRASRQRKHVITDLNGFDKILREPKTFAALKGECAREFCLENALFCEAFWAFQKRGKTVATTHSSAPSRRSLLINQSRGNFDILSAPPVPIVASALANTSLVVSVSAAPVANTNSKDKDASSVTPWELETSQQDSVLPNASLQSTSQVGDSMEDAGRQLYELFLKPRSPYELNIPAVVLSKLKNDLDAGGLGNVQTFEPIYEAVRYMIFTNTYPRYLARTKRHAAASQV